MVKKETHEEDAALGELLQREAEQTRPAFSDELHARICRAVAEADMAEPPRPADRRRVVRVMIDVVVAVSLLIGVVYLIGQAVAPDPTELNPTVPNPTVPNPNNLAGPGSTDHDVVEPEIDERLPTSIDVPANPAVDLGLLVDSTLTNRRWAYLEHDAQLAADMLLAQLPGSIVAPEERP